MRIAGTFVACALIWGSTFLAIRFGNEATPPVWAATIRLALASVLLFAIAGVLRQPLPRGRALRGAALWGLFNLGVNLSLLYIGETTVPSGISAVLFATVPLTTALLAALFGVEALVTRKLIAAIVAIGGVAVIFAGELGVAVPFAGLLTVFGAASAAALANVLLKQAPKQQVIPLNAIGTAVGAVVCLGVSVALGESHAVPATASAWLPILYLTLAGSLGAFVLFTWLVTHWSVSNASLLGVTVPIIAVILGGIVKGEQPATLTYVGAAIVISAILIALRSPHAQPAPAVAADAAD
ncbi:MAG TPA: EamA family transporter [Candidatus Limnocylindria bacterium]|nr:EamA family transporter [Candidatus Limnocylindria bacterium]